MHWAAKMVFCKNCKLSWLCKISCISSLKYSNFRYYWNKSLEQQWMHIRSRLWQGRLWTDVQRAVNSIVLPRISLTTCTAYWFVNTKSKNIESRPIFMCHQWEWIRSRALGALSLRINSIQDPCSFQDSVEVDRWKLKIFLFILGEKDRC